FFVFFSFSVCLSTFVLVSVLVCFVVFVLVIFVVAFFVGLVVVVLCFVVVWVVPLLRRFGLHFSLRHAAALRVRVSGALRA
ncbi:hypothetical protein ACQWHW_24505, partial [Salmonella enterica subsp. enterica serovar Infantis]